MKKYRVTYNLYGEGSNFAEYTTEFMSTEGYVYDVAVALIPASSLHLSWMIDSIEEVI